MLAAVTDFPINTFYAYAAGVDVCLLERGIDELSDISTGIAFVRGAARQYDKRWGIDLASWRTSNNAATQFNSQGVLTGGWSPSYLRRHYYISYMSGAHVLQNEAVVYYDGNGRLNPLGQATKEFADFALSRHPDVGRPAVSTALMVDFYNGFDAKHWLHNQADAVWYQDIGYSDGDYMINNFLKVAYPNHWLHGLAPGAPFLNSQGAPDPGLFQRYLALGGDPRPYEPMGFTRWGDNFDIITNTASLAALQQYKVIALMGSVPISAQLRDSLSKWVGGGGILVMNAAQASQADESNLGVKLGSTANSCITSRWLSDSTTYSEPAFSYIQVTPVTASVLATNGGTDALVTSNRVGQGEVILTTPLYLLSSAKDRMLAIGTRLFDWVQSRFALAQVVGPQVEYIVNQAPGRIIVTLVNNAGTAWNGTVAVNAPTDTFAVREYTADTNATYTRAAGQVLIAGQVPAYDVRIYAMEVNGSARMRRKKNLTLGREEAERAGKTR
jgi:hypothetical protein